MHRAFLIPEILTVILRRLDNANLVKAATVCRVWSEAALDILYHTIERDQWTHESFTQHALAKNAFRIREMHCSLYDDIWPFHQGLVQAAPLRAAQESGITRGEEMEDIQPGHKSTNSSRSVFIAPTMNQLRVLECPSVSIANAPLILDILRLNPGVEKLVLPLAEMVSPSSRKTRPTSSAFLQPPDECPPPPPPGYTSEASEALATLFSLVITKLPALRELTLRDWRLTEGDMERLLASPTLRQSLEVLDLDETHDGWYRSQQQRQPLDRLQRQWMRQYRDRWVALPQERVDAEAMSSSVHPTGKTRYGPAAEEILQDRKPFGKLRWLRVNGFPEGPLTLFKITRWCPNLRSLVLAADSREVSLFPGYRPQSSEAGAEESDDDDGDDEVEDEQAGGDSTASPRHRMLMPLDMFSNTLRAHCPNVVELKLEQMGIPYSKPFRCLLKAFSPTLRSSEMTVSHNTTTTTVTTPRQKGLRRFEVDGNMALPIDMLQHLIELAAQTLETVVLGPRILFFDNGHSARYQKLTGPGTVLDLLQSCPALTHVEVLSPSLKIDALEMLGLRSDDAQEGLQASHPLHALEVGHQEGDLQSSSPPLPREWKCHDTLEKLKCMILVTVPTEEMFRQDDVNSVLSLPTGEKIHDRILQFLKSMPRLRCSLEQSKSAFNCIEVKWYLTWDA
ncbi:hypothetical protein BGZ73_008495 [Actinomortierella ambigua]|nr:hypothetical protein BGZ73_008495 [Actinomortierella ambigua]